MLASDKGDCRLGSNDFGLVALLLVWKNMSWYPKLVMHDLIQFAFPCFRNFGKLLVRCATHVLEHFE